MRKKRRHTLIIDRWIDGDLASAELDGKTMVVVPRALLPSVAAPDDVLRVDRRPAAVEIAVDEEATLSARRDADRLSVRLKKGDSGGDVVL
jgi:hypothetical protein